MADDAGAVVLKRPHADGCVAPPAAAVSAPRAWAPAGARRPAGSPAFPAAGLLCSEESYAQWLARQLTNLIRVGGQLAVLGVEDNARAMGWWHICQPGTWSVPQGLSGQPEQEGDDLTYARALCGRRVVSNGYA